MKRINFFGIMLTAILMLSVSVDAQISATDIDKIVYEEMVRQEIPGLAIGVYKKGVINFTKGYGHIDLNRTKPINTITVFRWASISKTLTAVAALQLAEKRTDFNINDKVSKHYPYWTSNSANDKALKERITIKHLLTNRSGINYYTRGTKDEKGEYPTLKRSTYRTDTDKFNANSSVNIFKNSKLDFSPGAKYLYTTYGFNLLGAVIDKKTGSYTNWVNTNIKSKLGMTSLKVSNGYFYGFQKPRDGILKQGKDSDKEWVLPGGGWESNIKDLLKFAKGIIDGKLLNNTDLLWKTDYKQRYKRGVNSMGGANDFRIWHGGSHDNLRTLLYIMPKENIAVVVAYPTEYIDRVNLTRRIIKKLGFTRPVSLKPVDTCNSGMRSSEKKFIGVWRKTNKNVIIRRGYSSTNFNKEWNFLKKQGYQIFDIEAYKHSDGKIVWDGVFKKAGSGYAMWRNYDYDGFKAKWTEMNSKGYRLYDLETYKVGNNRKWAGLFKKGPGKYALWRNLSTSDFTSKRASMSSKGMKLIDIEVYGLGSKLKWSGVWVSGNGELVKWGNTWGNFNKLIKTREKQGYKLIDTERYLENGTSKWVGIWEKSTQKQKRSEGKNYCNFMDKKHSVFSEEGYELIDFDVYN